MEKEKNKMNNYIFYVTVPNLEESRKIARILVENKIVACVNIIKDVYSTYRWKDKIEDANEFLLIIKTSESKSDKLIKIINEIHSYETPECVGVKIEKGSRRYINWINEVT